MRLDVHCVIPSNVVPVSKRAASSCADEALSAPKLWGAREYVQANHQVPEGFYVIYSKLTKEEGRDYYFGEIAKKVLGGVETLKFQTLRRKTDVDWLFHIDPTTLLWGPLIHPQMFCYGVESDDYVLNYGEEDEV